MPVATIHVGLNESVSIQGSFCYELMFELLFQLEVY